MVFYVAVIILALSMLGRSILCYASAPSTPRKEIPENREMEHNYHFLPEELVSEILLRLPAKCLGRFKIVCKSWCSTINSHYFIARHLLLQNDTNLYLVVYSRAVISIGKTIHWLPYETLGAVDPTTYCSPIPDIDIFSVCNGLVLFSRLLDRTKLFLCNPTTGQTKLLPSSSTLRASLKDRHLVMYSGLGFNTKSMEYKVVLIFCRDSFVPIVVKMYSLKTNSWTTIATTLVLKATYGNWPGVFSNDGMLSWIGKYEMDGKTRNMIFSIDLSSDTITTTLCPSSIGYSYNCPSVYKESLALVDCCNFCTSKRCFETFDIWVLGECGVKESWKKLFTIGPLQGIERVLGFGKDAGKVFVEKRSEIHDCELLLLDIATQQTTSLQISKGFKMLFIARDSLVPLES